MKIFDVPLSAVDPKNLQRQADRFLARHGYRSDGRERGAVEWRQSVFEQRMPTAPFRGLSTRR